MDMEDDARNKVLKMSHEQLAQVAEVANQYPSVSLNAKLLSSDPGEDIEVEVHLERDGYEDDTLPPVKSSHFPEEKIEYWWVVVGDSDRNKIFTIRKVTFVRELKTKLRFKSPEAGKYSLLVYLICDCFIGCDHQSEPMPLEVFENDQE